MTQCNWKVYYTDGSTFSDLDGSPFEAPKTGVQVLNIRDGRKGRRTLKLVDYYVFSPNLDRWVDCVDSAAAMMRAAQEPWIVILFGEYIKEEDFEKVLIQAHSDPDFPAVAGNPWS